MNREESRIQMQRYILGAIGGILMAAGDWLLGCIPIAATDTGLFQRAYYLSGEYALWRPVVIVGLGAVGCFLYFFMVTAMNEDIYWFMKVKRFHFYCGIFMLVTALALHLWSATLAWFTSYLGPRVGSWAALKTVTTYQNNMFYAIIPMYLPLAGFLGLHWILVLTRGTRYPKWMAAFHPATWSILLALIPDIAQVLGAPGATWMAVMSQSSTNTSIVIWCVAAALYKGKMCWKFTCHSGHVDQG